MSQRARQARSQAAVRRSRMRWSAVGILGALIIGAALVLTIDVGSDDGSGDLPISTLTVSMTEYAFSPDPIVLPAGEHAVLEVVNDGAIPHDLLISELGKGTPDLASGDKMVLDLSDQPAGTYRVVCDLPGHADAGMVTQLVLE